MTVYWPLFNPIPFLLLKGFQRHLILCAHILASSSCLGISTRQMSLFLVRQTALVEALFAAILALVLIPLHKTSHSLQAVVGGHASTHFGMHFSGPGHPLWSIIPGHFSCVSSHVIGQCWYSQYCTGIDTGCTLSFGRHSGFTGHPFSSSGWAHSFSFGPQTTGQNPIHSGFTVWQ